jgi:hypothetical protein
LKVDAAGLGDDGSDGHRGPGALMRLDGQLGGSGGRQRSAAILPDDIELRLKCRGRGRRRDARDHRACHHSRRRTNRRSGSARRHPQRAHRRNDGNRSPDDGSRRDLSHELRIADGIRGHDSARDKRVLVDDRDVGPVRIVEVDVGHIDIVSTPVSPPRHEGISRRERKPADIAAAARGEGLGPTGAAPDKRHERGRISDRDRWSLRHPVPARCINRPSPVVVRRPSPGLVADPGPAPGVLPDPAPCPVWLPPGVDSGRCPALSVARNIAPAAVLVEIIEAVHVEIGISGG